MMSIEELVKELSDGIYHGTTVENLLRIVQSGFIAPARELAEHQPNYPQSRRSNCYELGAVSCFDFGQAAADMIFDSWEMQKWVPLLLPYHANSRHDTVVLIGFARTALDLKPLRYDQIKKQLGHGGIVPHGIECCYPGRMPLATSHKILFLRIGDNRTIRQVARCMPAGICEQTVLRMVGEMQDKQFDEMADQ